MDSDGEAMVPTVNVNGKNVLITDINDGIVAQMTQEEKDAYIETYREYYSVIFD